ncbi:MAG: hypothetical protein HYR89_12095 [Actinobacteria bacterium]|nr:hypothetical protein [Actinomycetota bacterium]
MNEIKMLANYRPEIEPLTDDERRQLWAAVSGEAMDRAVHLDDVAVGRATVELVHLNKHRRSDHRRRLVRAAVAAVVAVLGIGLAAINGRGGEAPAEAPVTSSGPAAAPAVTSVALIPESLSTTGLRLSHPGGTSIRDEPSLFQRRVFGSADDPPDPTRMIHIEYAADGSSPMGSCRDKLPFDVSGTTGSTCTYDGHLIAGWEVDGLMVELYAGTAVTREQVVEFTRSLRTVPATAAGGPPFDLVADPIPYGWTVLVGEDVPYAQRITESGWVATPSGADDDPRQLVVHTWTGVDAQGVYAKQPPIGADRITIRGHDGYVYQSDQRGAHGPQQLDIWWTEQPGMVVWVSTTDLYPAAQLIEIIEKMLPVDDAGFAAFNADPSNY